MHAHEVCTSRSYLGGQAGRLGAKIIDVAYKFNNLVSAHFNSLDPNTACLGYCSNNDEATVVISNCSLSLSTEPTVTFVDAHKTESSVVEARDICVNPSEDYLNAITNASTHVIADTGVTLIFIMDGINIVNKRVALQPLTIYLPDGRKVKSSHICNIMIPGLPQVLTGHVVPHLAIASLIGIRTLCNAGCKVTFDQEKCDVIYDGKVILRGFKVRATDLWTLSINANMQTALSRLAPVSDCALRDIPVDFHPGMNLALFTHSTKTRAKGVKFAHQSLCNPKILTQSSSKGIPERVS
jgi:hypothetical protein